MAPSLASAEEHREPLKEKSAFEQALSSGEGLYSTDSIIEANGRRFRRIEYKTDVYYLQLLASENDNS
jgi:hypothetical protein